ncbi:MAG: hypothetical protein Q7U54_17150 [Bacteroidales bacterium]|nr:hypothetical protein [Bacteroidales bacterium]
MCFSATASFAGGVIISVIGVAVVTKVHKPSQLLFTSIPLFFGLQQFTEGVLWLTIPNPDYAALQKIATYIFLVMADVLWPTLIPLAVLMMESNARKRKIIRLLLLAGLSVSIYYTCCLLFLNVTPQINGYHIMYNSDFPKLIAIPVFILYLIATLTPLFISSIERTHMMGILMFFSCLVTAIFFTQYLTSVWCFFAALISGVIYWILSDAKKKFKFANLEILKNKF